MMTCIKKFAIVCFVILMASCSSEPTLQEYFVAKGEHSDFISFDVPPSLLNLETANLNASQKVVAASLKKFNILAFKKGDDNIVAYEKESATVKAILKNTNYNELMRMNTSFGKAVIQVKGDDAQIDEVIIYGDHKDKGFALIRVLGDDMKTESLLELLQAIEKSENKDKGLEKLGRLFNF